MKNILLFLLALNISNLVNAQTDSTDYKLKKLVNDSSIVLELRITIDSISFYDTSYVLSVINFYTGKETLMHVSNHFDMYLDYDTKFEVSISHPTTDCKAIFLDTHAPKDQWHIISGFKLSKSNNKEKVFVGSMIYDETTGTFVKKKPE